MTEIQKRIAKLQIQLEWLESKCHLFKADLIREKILISSQEMMLKTLENSLSNLKKQGIVSSIREFDKIKKEIAVLTNRMQLSAQIIKHYEFNLQQAEDDVKATKDLIRFLEQHPSSKTNVIPFKRAIDDKQTK